MIMAGGTGGHVFPALAVADRLRAQGADVFWLGTRQGLEARVVPAHGLEIEWVDVQGLRSTGWTRWLAAPLKLTHAMFQVFTVLRRRKPSVILGMGGFVSGPGGVMSRLMGIPLVIHEQNALPGMTNRWLSHIANRVLAAFPGALPKAVVCGNPVRENIQALASPEERFGDRSGAIRLLILGGSQGAQALNEAVPAMLNSLGEADQPEVWHQTGQRDIDATLQRYEQAAVQGKIMSFIEDMAAAYAWADVVVCRAGALTIAELTAAGVGAVLVPYPYAVDDHQTKNAEYLVSGKAGYLLPQSELNAARLKEMLLPLLRDRVAALTLAKAARALAQPRAAETVAQVCLEVGQV